MTITSQKGFPIIILICGVAGTTLLCSLLVVFLPKDALPQSNVDQEQDKVGDLPCASRMCNSDSVVCVCNSTYCDTISEVLLIPSGQAITYTSSKSGLRFAKQTLNFQSGTPSSGWNLIVNTTERFQKLIGFGGAFTDAAGINIASLSSEAQNYFLRSYFSDQGIGFNMGRIPMASVDFSTHLYTYADQPNDFEMKNFSLASEDFQYKIPYIKKAVEMSNRNSFRLFGSPWSAPAWMKTNNALIGKGSLIGRAGNKYHKAWALYFARFLEEYKANGVDIWAVTAQNEPIDGLAGNFSFQCMGWTAEHQRDFIKTDLGPTLHSRGHGDVKVIIGDDQRLVFPRWAEVVLNDTSASQYVSGIGVHWYMDWILPISRISDTHKAFPDYFILGTEACSGAMPFQPDKVILGSWTRGQRYSMDIIQDLNHWVAGWVDWNLALDMEGGPNWVKNFVDAAIIVNAESDEFYKQPIFYHLGHFSKFLREDSVRISLHEENEESSLKHVAFIDDEKSIVTIVLLNTSQQNQTINVIYDRLYVRTELPADSIQTVIFNSL
ncbi:lysosomal acid glucosylceramidase-like [Ciona intestinalis]